MSMNVIYSLSDKNINELYELYQKEWWTKGRTFQETKQVVEGSQVNIGIVDNKNILVAYARVLTDFTFKALIFDLIVCQSQRKCGLGGKLLDLILAHEKLRGIKSFELYCLPEMFPFYEKYGFSSDVSGIKLMRKLS